MELFKLFGTIAVDHSKADEAIKQTVKQSSKIGESFSESEKKAGKSLSQIAAESGKSMNEVRSDVAKMAAEYRKQGMSASDAMKKAYEDIGYSSESAHKKMDDGLDKTSETAEKSESRITNAFKKIGAAITTYFAVDKLVSFGKSVVDTTASFEDGMLKVQSLSGATQDEYKKLSDAALNYGSTTAWTAKDVSDAMGYMALAGFNTNEILESTSGMLSLASASGEDLATVTDILTDSMTGFGDSASDASRYADVLATVQAKSNTTVGDLGEAFTYVSSLAGTYKYSLEDVSAALGTMANAGVKGSMAGTSLSSIITRLGTNTSGARDAIEALGVQFYNQDGTARSLGDVITDLCDATSGMDVEQKAALASTVAGAEAQKGLLAILNQGSGAYTDLQEKLNNCSGAATDMSNNMESGLGGAIRSMSSAWEGFKINLGEKFEEPLGNAIRNAASWLSETATPKLMDFIDKAVDGFGKFKEDMQPAVEGLKDALGKLKDAFQPIVDVFKPLVDKIKEYASEGKIAGGATTVLSGVVNALSGGIQVAAGVFGTIAGAIKKVTDFVKEHKGALEVLGVAVATITALIIAYNASFIAGTVMYNIGAAGIGLMSAATTVWTAVSSAASAATTALGAAFTFLTSPIGIIIIAIGAAIAVGILLYKNWDKIKEKLSALWDSIKEIWENIKSTIVEKVETIKENVTNAFNAIKDRVQNNFEVLKNFITTVWNTIKNTIITVINAIKNGITNAMNAIKQTITTILNAVKTVFTGIWNSIKTTVSNVINGIKSVISGGLNGAKDIVSNVLGRIKDKFTSIFDSVKNVVKNAIEKIKGFFHFSWSLPKLKMPHPKISGKFSLNPPSVPKFSIDWYKKAMDDPYMFSQPTAFGVNPETGNLRAAGEAGDEMMYGHSNLMDDIQTAVGVRDNVIIDTLNRWFKRLLDMFEEWFPQFKGQLVLDTGVLVAETAPQLDKALGKLQINRNRGR